MPESFRAIARVGYNMKNLIPVFLDVHFAPWPDLKNSDKCGPAWYWETH